MDKVSTQLIFHKSRVTSNNLHSHKSLQSWHPTTSIKAGNVAGQGVAINYIKATQLNIEISISCNISIPILIFFKYCWSGSRPRSNKLPSGSSWLHCSRGRGLGQPGTKGPGCGNLCWIVRKQKRLFFGQPKNQFNFEPRIWLSSGSKTTSGLLEETLARWAFSFSVALYIDCLLETNKQLIWSWENMIYTHWE